MRTQRFRPNYTVDHYRTWKGDWELIDGVPSAMTPSPSPLHQLVAKGLVTQLDNSLLKNKDCGDCEVVYELDWFVDDYTVLRPDIAIVCGFDINQPLTKAPWLIIEIISPSSGLVDRHTKFEIYEEEQVPYYIIVDPLREHYQIFALQNSSYEEQSGVPTLNLHAACDIAIDVPSIFKRVKK